MMLSSQVWQSWDKHYAMEWMRGLHNTDMDDPLPEQDLDCCRREFHLEEEEVEDILRPGSGLHSAASRTTSLSAEVLHHH